MRMVWGQSTKIDVTKCDISILKSKAQLQEFVIGLCKLLEIERSQDIVLNEFGDSGFVVYQLCKEGIITGIFSFETGIVLVDILCKTNIDYQRSTEYTADFFKGNRHVALAQIARRGEDYVGN